MECQESEKNIFVENCDTIDVDTIDIKEKCYDKSVKKSTHRRKRSRLTLVSRKSTKTYSCSQCKAVFSRQSLLKFHANSHVNGGNKDFQCKECVINFSTSIKLLRHKQEIHSYILKCEECGNEFSHIMSYKVHMRVHAGERPYTCNECDAKFTQSSHLIIHKRGHTGEKPYQCETCHQCFKQTSHLRAHERIHSQHKPYVCDHCGAAFIQKSSLKRHLRVHTGEKPYVCDVCSTSFCVKNNLTRHMLRHSGERNFECQQCKATFNQSFDLKRHEMSHSGLKPFECDVCKTAFSRKANLKWHRLTHTGETPLKCDICPAKFMKPRDLRKHKILHESYYFVKCSQCAETFSKEEDLTRHMSKHNKQNTICEKCHKIFSTSSCLKRHMLTHTHVYKCNICLSIFKDVHTLQNHNKSCGKENVSTKELMEEHQQLSEPQIIQFEALQQIPVNKYLQIQNISSQGNFPCGISNTGNFQQSSFICDPNCYATIAHIPTVFSALQNENMKIARPSLGCPNTDAHIYTVGSNSQLDSWCFCESNVISGNSIATDTIFTSNQQVEYSQVQSKYVTSQTYQTDLNIGNVVSQPVVLGTVNIGPLMSESTVQISNAK